MSRLAPISKTEPILNFVKTKLAALKTSENENRFSQIEKFPGTSAEALFEFLPALTLPCAAIVYGGSDIANFPLRKLFVSIAIVTEMYEGDDAEDLRAHIDAVITELDEQLDGSVKYEVIGDKAFDLPGSPTLAAAFVNLEIRDH
jgi:hypothetical protein